MKSERISYKNRAEYCKNLLAKELLLLIDEKKTNLALSADVTSAAALLDLANNLASEICVLKTHIDIIEDFTPTLTKQLAALAKQKRFLIFEDRKFADIGNTVKQQYQGGIYKIADWADIVNAHTLPGPGIITALSEVGLKKQRGLLLLAEMSSANNLLDKNYAAKTLKMAEEFPEFVIGFIAQHKLSVDPRWIYLTPGVQLNEGKDALGQQYITPKIAIEEHASDVIIVGRGIVSANNPLATAKEYREAGWQAYETSLNALTKTL